MSLALALAHSLPLSHGAQLAVPQQRNAAAVHTTAAVGRKVGRRMRRAGRGVRGELARRPR